MKWLVIHDNDRLCMIDIFCQIIDRLPYLSGKAANRTVFSADDLHSGNFYHLISKYSNPMLLNILYRWLDAADIFMIAGNGESAISGFELPKRFAKIELNDRFDIAIDYIAG